MTRAQIADPHGREDPRRPRGRDQAVRRRQLCIDRQYDGLDVLCVQNAATTRETTMPHRIAPTRGRRRRIVVVGGAGGHGGGARQRRARHEVVLLESNAALGGQILLAARAPQREQMAGIVRWFDLEIKRLGIDCRLGQAADADDARAGSRHRGAGHRRQSCAPPAGLGRGRRPGRQRLGRAGGRVEPPGACWSMTASAPTRARGGRLHRQPRRTGRSGDAGHQGLRSVGGTTFPISTAGSTRNRSC